MTATCSRRAFLQHALLQLGSLPMLGAIACTEDSDPARRLTLSVPLRAKLRARVDAAVLADYFDEGDTRAIELVGARYIYLRLHQTHPPDADVMSLLEPTLTMLESAQDAEAVLDDLRGAIIAEFSERDVIDLAGWTLAPTELGLAALYFATA